MNEQLVEILQRLVAVETKVTIMMGAYGLTIAGMIMIGMKKVFNGGKKNGKS